MKLTPKNWANFQHYKDRSPAWIKLHRGILDDYAFACLPVASRALAPLLWLLASEYEHGEITASPKEIAFRLRMPEKELRDALKPLIDSGFFIDASNTLAECKQDAIPEREKEGELEKRKNIRAVADATRPDPFENQFWKLYPKRDGANPKAPARKKYLAAIKSGADPGEIEAAVKRFAAECRTKGIVGSPYVPQALTWLNQQRWGDYAPPAGTSDAGPPVPPNPNLPTHEELQRKYGRDNGTAAAAPEGDRRGQDHAGKLLREGPGDDPESLSGQGADNQTRNGGIRRLGEVFRRSSALAALGDQGNGRAELAGDDGPGAMAGMVRS